ncbi:MAG: hypothetical protein ACLGXA_22480 [Acidobacteriota bacterium]
MTAIVVYPDSGGQDAAQISNFVLDQKNEVNQCAGAGKIDKAAYHKLSKLTLSSDMVLERNAQGVLMLSIHGQAPFCVVPGNLKLEKTDNLSPSTLADRATVEGTVLPGSDPPITQAPPLKIGTKIVFVTAPDAELTNFLRAQQQGDVAGWNRYLAADGHGKHSADARKALSGLYLKSGDADLDAYLSTKTGATPDFAKLADARQMADQSHAQVPDDPATAELYKKIHAEVLDLSQRSAAKLESYRAALKNQKPGYADLVSAETLSDGAYQVDPSVPEVDAAEQQTKMEQARLDKALRTAEQQVAAQRPDDAALAIAPYQAFQDENPKIASDLHSIASSYVARAKKSQANSDWKGAVSDLQKAQVLVPSPDTATLLSAAQQQAHNAANQAAVQAALQKSQAAAANQDFIHAYEVLDDLSPEQHAQVTDQLQALQEQYVTAAENQAKSLQKAYEPINGTGDEQGILEAYELTQRCFRLTQDPTLKDQLDILAGDLTTWYLKQGTKYADKPDGTGVNLAWAYLSEALHFSSQTNSGDVRDEMERVRAKHRIKSAISIRVEFRDSTSRRDSVDFATQLSDAMAAGLESAGTNVHVIRPTDTPAVPANFQLVGDVIQHDLGKSNETIPRQSKFKSGDRQVRNPEFVKATADIDQAKDDLQMARTELQDALSKNKKKDIEAARKTVADDEQKIRDLNTKVSTLQEFNLVPIVDNYNYVERIVHVHPTIVIQFRIVDASGNEVVPEVPVREEIPDQYSQFEGVQATDTEGIHAKAGIEPDDADFYRKSEYAARDALVKQAEQKVAGLPEIVMQRADQRAADGDIDGAGQFYILYLNSTPNADTPERAKARAFLMKQFSFGDLALQAPPA